MSADAEPIYADPYTRISWLHGELQHRQGQLAALRVELQAAREQAAANADKVRLERERREQSERDEGEAWAQWNEMSEKMAASNGRAYKAEAALQAAQEALRCIAENAESWHGPEPDRGHVRALKVIAEWARAVLVEGACGRGVEALLDSDDFAILNEETRSAAVEGERTDGRDNGESPPDDPECGTDIGPFGGADAPGGEGT